MNFFCKNRGDEFIVGLIENRGDNVFILVSKNDAPTPEGESMPESESISVYPELKADLDCASRIESAINTEEK